MGRMNELIIIRLHISLIGIYDPNCLIEFLGLIQSAAHKCCHKSHGYLHKLFLDSYSDERRLVWETEMTLTC